MVENFVLTLNTDHGIAITISLLVIHFAHQLKDYSISPQGEVFAKALKGWREIHPCAVNFLYTKEHLTALRKLTNTANNTQC